MSRTAEEEWTRIIAPLVKVGNSFSIRIPMHVIKELGMGKSDTMEAKVRKYDLVMTPEVADFWFRMARQSRALNGFGDEKIRLLSRLAFTEGAEVLKACGKKITEELSDNTSLRTMNKTRKEYRANIKKEFGITVHHDYLIFRKHIETEMKKA